MNIYIFNNLENQSEEVMDADDDEEDDEFMDAEDDEDDEDYEPDDDDEEDDEPDEEDDEPDEDDEDDEEDDEEDETIKEPKMKKRKIEKKKNRKNKKELKKKKYLKIFKSFIKNKKNISYFNENYTTREKKNIIKQIKLLNINNTNIPKLFELIFSNIPNKIKCVIFNKINTLSLLSPENGEYYKLNKWIDSVMSIPFEKYNYLPVSIKDGNDKCKEYINNCKKILDDTVYGMNDSKEQFMLLISQWVMNPASVGSSIALKGPMGTGKTTLLKNGISKLLNREFVLIPLGGANDGSYLEGHSYTYEGSTYGKIVDILIQCKSNNPIIYFDELDKVSDSSKGEEIIGILTHLTDITQNMYFQDKYFSEIYIDMSKCLFIFSYNDEERVNKILKDRLYVIETGGYSDKEKIEITRKFLIPTIEKKLDQYNSITFTDAILEYIIQKKTEEEKGVRSLKRNLEIIFNKINLYSILGVNNTKELNNITLPLNLTNSIVDVLIHNKNENYTHNFMYL